MSTELVKLVAVQPIGYKADPEATNLTIAEPGSDFEVNEHSARQLVEEGSAAKPGSKEANAAKKAAKADDDADDE